METKKIIKENWQNVYNKYKRKTKLKRKAGETKIGSKVKQKDKKKKENEMR